MTKSKPLVFFGSGPVAKFTLKSLSDNFDVSAVVTKPKPEHGHQSTPPVEALAEELGIKTHFVSDKAELSGLIVGGNLETYTGVVVDFGIIIPKDVIESFEKGIVNSHFSLLPLWRGADPITFPILSGDKETGVSLMLINEKMDEGQLIAQDKVPLADQETSESLTTKLIGLSNVLLNANLPDYFDGKIEPWDQDSNIEPTYSRKLSKDDGKIDWNKPAEQIEREIRAFNIWPKSSGVIKDIDVVITSAEVANESGPAGNFHSDSGNLVVFCGDKALNILKLKVSGKPEMTGADFINGYLKS